MQDTGPLRSLKERQRQAREDLILRTAEEVILEKGFHETSMDEIAARVGIAKGTLYLHFARKEDMVYAIFERSLRTFQEALNATESMSATVREKLQFLLHSMYLGLLGKDARLLYSFYNSVELHTIMKSHRSEWHHLIGDRIMRLLEQGKVAGEFDPTIPTNVMLSTFMSLLSPRAYHMLVVEGSISIEELVHYVSRIYFRGIAATSDH
jgi:AcrR family transcriptional regulator